MLTLPIYKLGTVYYLHIRIAGKQVKKSLRTGYKREALSRALALLHHMTKTTPVPPEKYELDASRGIFKADGAKDHARLMEAIEALKTLQSGLPFAAPAVAPAAAPQPAERPHGLEAGRAGREVLFAEKSEASHREFICAVPCRGGRACGLPGQPRHHAHRSQRHNALLRASRQKSNGPRTIDNKTCNLPK